MSHSKSKPLSNPAILQRIDELRERNIGQHVPLPQLVVVGDQSSGKSRTLRSLTGIPFLCNVELCTRHATQITSRRDPQNRVEIKIIPGPNASEEHKRSVESYTEVFASSKDLRRGFTNILTKVSETMGIRTDTSLNSGPVFSEDVLKIEICGPDEDYLTVIDVPGIFRTPTEGITTKEDINLVHNLIRRYITNRRTIILAVLPSNVDIATQEILALAQQYDPMGDRTLGVLTKPDLVKESAAKASVCNLVSGKRMQLSLGYYLVRNRGGDDEDTVGDEALESMFKEEPWSGLPGDRVGIHALKQQLGYLLAQITRREFPTLRKEVLSQASKCQKELDGIGPARPTEREQRRFLGDIARSFEDLARRAVDAQYSHDPLFEDLGVRLVTRLVNLTEAFSRSFLQYGHHRWFEHDESAADSAETKSEVDSLAGLADEDMKDSFCFHKHLVQELNEKSNFGCGKYPELEDLLAENVTIKSPVYGIMAWIKDLNLQSRGMYMGTFNPELLSAAFREQSHQWEKMVMVYMGEVVRLIHHFATKALGFICSDTNVVREIWSEIMDTMLARYKSGLDQALLLVDVERSYLPYTLNPVFYRDFQSSRGRRTQSVLRPKAWPLKASQFQDTPRMVVNLDDVPEATTAQGNEECLVEEIHDKLRSYYHLAADRVMDNILLQAVCHQLLKGPHSPLAVFSQSWVTDLDATKLDLIAGETEAVKKRRQILVKKLKDLRFAIDVLKG